MTSPDDPFLPLSFSLFSNPGAYAILAGAGVSRGAALPTAWDVVVDLIQQIAGEEEAANIDADSAEAWYEARFGRTPTYSDVVEQLALTPTERQTLLRGYFEQTDEDGNVTSPGPSIAHRSIARLMQAGIVRVVITLNFDRLFEQALRELGIEPTIIATESDARGMAPLHTLQHCVIHLHGDYLNAASMRNTTAELSGYGRNMRALLKRVLEDYGLVAAGWSVQHDHALREAVAAQHNPRFTMGWVSPGSLSEAAAALVSSKRGVVLATTADDAFGHLADQVEAMRSRSARHPLSLAVAVSRIKRELAGRGAAIAAHDMLAGELTALRGHAAFHLVNYSDTSILPTLREQVIEASRIPAGSVAALAYWGDATTDKWWLADLERFTRPARRVSGVVALLELPFVAGSLLFYCAGVSAIAAQRFDLVGTLFTLRGIRTDLRPAPIGEMLAPGMLMDIGIVPGSYYETVAQLVGESLGLGAEPVDDALQTFEILRGCTAAMAADGYQGQVDEFVEHDLDFGKAQTIGEQSNAHTSRIQVLDRVAQACGTSVFSAHLHASDRSWEEGVGRRWRAPVAERLAEEVKRLGDRHPLVSAWGVSPEAMWLAIEGVSAAAGRAAREIEMRFIPVGAVGVLPDDLWLDTGRPREI